MKIHLFLLVTLLMIFIPVSSAQLPPQEWAVVCHHIPMNIRAEPRTDSESLGQIQPGTYLTVLERDQDDYRGYPWSYVRVEGTELVGWVFADYIAYLPVYAAVSLDALTVRTEPWSHADPVSVFTSGETVEVLGRETIYGNGDAWLYIRNLTSNVQGWARSIYLRGEICYSQLPVMAQVSPATPIAATIWGTRDFTLQADDSHDAPEIAHLTNGTRVAILEMYRLPHSRSYWMYMQVVGSPVSGWFYTRTLAYDAIQYLPMKVRIMAADLNVRALPGTDSEVVNKLSQDSCVVVTDTVSQDEIGWFYAPEAGGWVSSQYTDVCF